MSASDSSSSEIADQAALRALLQSAHPAKLERLAASLFGALVDVPLAVAAAGGQSGGDLGTAGRQGRRLRVECKRYGDSTSLSVRELLGEIDHALDKDDALEAWILVATREVPEQAAVDLSKHGERLGVPVIVIDWPEVGAAPLAALCGGFPELVAEVVSDEAGRLAGNIKVATAGALQQIERDLRSWIVGFGRLRLVSHEKVQAVWNSPKSSNAELGQDSAGGARTKKVRRDRVHATLDAWWSISDRDSPAMVAGWGGVGKTWTSLSWLVERLDDLPIVLVTASSAAASLRTVSETAVKAFLAERLSELGGERDARYWRRRLDRVLSRPEHEGPAILLLIDGLNQQESLDWLAILKVLQGPGFSGRVRLFTTTRQHHLEQLSGFRGLVTSATPIEVDAFDLEPGGELEQMLAFEGLQRTALHADLIELARIPRLFDLVVRFKDRLVEADQITVHRLLWEYGRDTLGARAGKSFSEAEWRDWLQEVAGVYRKGVKQFTLKELSDTAARPDLSPGQVYARLSEIIDGQFAVRRQDGGLELSPTLLAHALGVALLAHLATSPDTSADALHADLQDWLDPIAGFDERAEILRAAVSILIERGEAGVGPIAAALVCSWLQTQNVSDQHRLEVVALATHLVTPLLVTVERSSPRANGAAQAWAVDALRAVPRSDEAALKTITARLTDWFRQTSLGVRTFGGDDAQEGRRSRHMVERIGFDAAGPHVVLGIDLDFHFDETGAPTHVAAAILEGFPLAPAIAVFEVAAVARAIVGHDSAWDDLRWLSILNERDPDAFAQDLRARAQAYLTRPPEDGVDPRLGPRVAALLLWLSGGEPEDSEANRVDPGIDRAFEYDADYLQNPGRSWFALERRHAEQVLADTSLRLGARLQRVGDLLFDPTFDPPEQFAHEIREAGRALDVTKLNRVGMHTAEDGHYDDLEPALARCAPDVLADIAQRTVQSFADRPMEERYWAAISACEALVLADDRDVAPARALRLLGKDKDTSQEAFAATRLLILEILHRPPLEQCIALIEADLKFILTEVGHIVGPLSAGEVEALLDRFGNGPPKAAHDLLLLLTAVPADLGPKGWAWVEARAATEDDDQGVAYRALAQADAARFARTLQAWDWKWDPAHPVWVNHYGSTAIIEGLHAAPFDEIAERVAPSRLLEAARRRGADPAEVSMASDIFGHVLAAPHLEAVDPGSQLSIDRTDDPKNPLAFSVEPYEEEREDPFEGIKAALDFDARNKARRRAGKVAAQRIDAARAAGANLLLADVAPEDFAPVIAQRPDQIRAWLSGMVDVTPDFQRRVGLAELAYLSLCEALLASSPQEGTTLWRALRETLTTKFEGVAGVDELLHVLFRVPTSPEVEALRQSALSPATSNTDRALHDLCLAATLGGHRAWIDDQIAADAASPLSWRQRRAIMLSGFLTEADTNEAGAWPEGEGASGYDDQRRRAARSRSLDACARHWWRVYLAADTPQAAFSAWVLLKGAADLRAKTWMKADAARANSLDRVRTAQVELNRHSLTRAMQKRSERFDKTFLGRSVGQGFGPWAKGLRPLR